MQIKNIGSIPKFIILFTFFDYLSLIGQSKGNHSWSPLSVCFHWLICNFEDCRCNSGIGNENVVHGIKYFVARIKPISLPTRIKWWKDKNLSIVDGYSTDCFRSSRWSIMTIPVLLLVITGDFVELPPHLLVFLMCLVCV